MSASAQLYNGKTLDELSDAEALALAGHYGPGIIGQELYERAEAIRIATDNGKFGPALLDPNYNAKDVKAAIAASDPTWDHLSRADVAALADVHGISYKAKASRTSLIELLTAAGIVPPEPDAGATV